MEAKDTIVLNWRKKNLILKALFETWKETKYRRRQSEANCIQWGWGMKKITHYCITWYPSLIGLATVNKLHYSISIWGWICGVGERQGKGEINMHIELSQIE